MTKATISSLLRTFLNFFSKKRLVAKINKMKFWNILVHAWLQPSSSLLHFLLRKFDFRNYLFFGTIRGRKAEHGCVWMIFMWNKSIMKTVVYSIQFDFNTIWIFSRMKSCARATPIRKGRCYSPVRLMCILWFNDFVKGINTSVWANSHFDTKKVCFYIILRHRPPTQNRLKKS